MSKVSFLGAGSWGTALAIMLAQNGHDVTLWSKVQAEVDMLQQHREHIHETTGFYCCHFRLKTGLRGQ